MAEASKKDISEKGSALEKRIKKHVIGKPHRFTAVAPLGFENTLAEELKHIGIECSLEISNSDSAAESVCAAGLKVAGIKVAGDGKVEFTAKITEAWKAVAYSRIANRVLMEIGSFKAENFGQLEKGTAGVPWELYIGDRRHPERSEENASCHSERSEAKSRNLDIHVTCKHSRLYHSDAVEERVRKVIIEAKRLQVPGSRSNTESKEIMPAPAAAITSQTTSPSPCQHLYVTLIDDRCTLWLDLAGEELYKRGHERFVAEAPLKETIAAAMIFEACRLQVPGSRLQASGDNTASATPQSERCERPHTSKRSDLITFIDPMAGSGTFSLETAYIANGLIPGKCRDFALKHQPAFKEGTWNFILKGAAETCPTSLRIITSDIDQRPISIIKHNVEVSPLAEIAQTNPDAVTINPQLKDFFTYSAQDIPDGAIILLNPPYGKRLAFNAPKLYTKIGQKLTEWNRDTQSRNQSITVAILVPKDCMSNLLQACPTLDPHHNDTVKKIETSHGGFSLNAIFAKI